VAGGPQPMERFKKENRLWNFFFFVEMSGGQTNGDATFLFFIDQDTPPRGRIGSPEQSGV
jgi:hypothetical protein